MDGTIRPLSLALLLAACVTPAAAGELGIVRIVCDHETHSVHFTGTHIGDGLILTCGHCCRDAGGPGASTRILVLSDETWRPVRETRGRVICSNARADVGLLRLEKANAMRAAHRLADRGSTFRPGERAALYLWANEDGRWRLRSRVCSVTRIDPFLELRATEVGCPIRQGDSGSPIVSVRTRRVMGVASGVLPHSGRSVYSDLTAVYELLDECSSIGSHGR